VPSGRPVLLVDSSPAFRAAVNRQLRHSRNFHVVGEASNASDASLLAARLRPALILLDVDLPDDSGVKTALWMQSLTPAPRVLLCSAQRRTDVQREIAASGLPCIAKTEFSESALLNSMVYPDEPRPGNSSSSRR
jgi:two-component system chemotaxis response regulator CheY